MKIDFLSSYFIKATEYAAIACLGHIGSGDKEAADAAAVEELRNHLNEVPMNGRIVIGEGERDEAPMLFIGEEVGEKGQNDPHIDIAIDPLEGTTLTAKGQNDALCVMACAPKGGLLHAPDVYMDKIAIGPVKGAGDDKIIDITASVKDNLLALAKAKNKDVKDITVCILDRERHEYIKEEALSLGAKICLINDGDVAGIIRAALDDDPIDIYIGQGGAPEGVLAAAALKCLGGQIQTRLFFRTDAERQRAQSAGIKDLDRIYNLDEMCSDHVVFCASGVTDGALVHGVKEKGDFYLCQTMFLSSNLKEQKIITSHIRK